MIVINNRDFNIDQNNRDYDFGHNRAALPLSDNNLCGKKKQKNVFL